jgi:hypothetical protein
MQSLILPENKELLEDIRAGLTALDATLSWWRSSWF